MFGAFFLICHALLFSLAIALRSTRARAPDAGRDVGELLGRARTRKGSEDGIAVLSSTWLSDEKVLVNPAASEVVAEANEMVEHASVPRDILCVRNWSQSCPDGWDTLDSQMCLAPSSYNGPCRRTHSFATSSGLEKSKFASSCKSPWPCEDGCANGHNYDVCPQGWVSKADGFCENLPENANSASCAGKFHFKDISIEQRQELALACGFSWPCKATCVQDYRNQCPEGWAALSEMCVAPAVYAGDCSYSLNTTGMTSEQKRAFAQKCAAPFACTGSATSNWQLGSRAASAHLIKDGPVNGISKEVSVSSEELNSFGTSSGNFLIPSGPVDESGDIHF